MNLLLDTVLFVRNDQQSINLTTGEKFLLVILASRIGNNENTWVNQETLAKDCGIKRRQLIYSLNSLKDKNLIKVDKNGKSNRYALVFTDVQSTAYEVQDTAHQHVQSTAHIEHQHVQSSAHDISDTCNTLHMYREVFGSETHVAVGLQGNETSPKETIKANKQLKANKQRTTKTTKAVIEDKVELPDWLPQSEWDDFLEHRRQLKAPMSILAQKRGIRVLSDLRDKGQDILKVIEQSIVNGWKGLFPIKCYGANNHGEPQLTRAQLSVQRYLESLNGL